MDRLTAVINALGQDKHRLVIDLSCRRQEAVKWIVAMNKWQTMTDLELNQGWRSIDYFRSLTNFWKLESITMLEPFCSEFLIHAADNEGLQQGIDERLVEKLGQWCSIPVTYAGGGFTIDDLHRVHELSAGRVDLTIGSALDIFGGQAVKIYDCVEWNNRHAQTDLSP